MSNSRSFRESESFDAKLRNTNSESDVKDRFGSPVNRSFCAHMKSKKDFLRTPSPLLGDKYANLFQNVLCFHASDLLIVFKRDQKIK